MVAFANTGPVWVVTLDESETQSLPELLKPGGAIAVAVAAAVPPAILAVAAIASAIPYVLLIDKIGGKHGVEITGVVGTAGVIVTPRGVSGIYGQLIEAARVEVTVRLLIDFVIRASGQLPVLGEVLGFSTVAAVLGGVVGGLTLGAALAVASKLFHPSIEPNDYGHVEANRGQVGPWELFVLAHLGNGNQVSLLSWQGLFSAQGGGGPVYANRPQLGPWETWNLIDNNDGSVSFQSVNGHYLCAEGGGGTFCVANRTAIGGWERFIIENHPNGHIALKTHDNGNYVSIQPRQS